MPKHNGAGVFSAPCPLLFLLARPLAERVLLTEYVLYSVPSIELDFLRLEFSAIVLFATVAVVLSLERKK